MIMIQATSSLTDCNGRHLGTETRVNEEQGNSRGFWFQASLIGRSRGRSNWWYYSQLLYLMECCKIRNFLLATFFTLFVNPVCVWCYGAGIMVNKCHRACRNPNTRLMHVFFNLVGNVHVKFSLAGSSLVYNLKKKLDGLHGLSFKSVLMLVKSVFSFLSFYKLLNGI